MNIVRVYCTCVQVYMCYLNVNTEYTGGHVNLYYDHPYYSQTVLTLL